MINIFYPNELEIYDNMSDNFNYVYNLSKDKKFKLPYLTHSLHKYCDRFIINGKVTSVYLSCWISDTRTIAGRTVAVGIYEWPNFYVLRITNWLGWKFEHKFYTLEEIPTWKDIEMLVRSDFD